MDFFWGLFTGLAIAGFLAALFVIELNRSAGPKF